MGARIFANNQELMEAIKLNPTMQGPDSEVFLEADKNLTYGTVVQIMGVIKDAGVKKLNLVTNPLE